MAVADLFQHVTDLATSDGNPPPWPAHGAVVALLDDSDQLIQLLTTQNLRKAMVQRLKDPGQNDPKRPRADLRAITRRVAWTPTYSQFESAWRYLNLSRRLLPNEYRKQLAFKPSWFVGLDMSERHPRWTASDTVFQRSVEVGPFSSRRRALGFITWLEDFFDLCRRHDILVQEPTGKACAYFDMGQCPAPCNGTIPMTEYRTQLERSIEFAAATRDVRVEVIRQEMLVSSSLMNFERAARLKPYLKPLDESASQAMDYREQASRLDELRILILQKGSRRKNRMIFCFDQGVIIEGQEVTLDKLGKIAECWWDATKLTNEAIHHDEEPVVRSENVSLLAHFMRKRGSAAGSFFARSRLSSLENLLQQISQCVGAEVVR